MINEERYHKLAKLANIWADYKGGNITPQRFGQKVVNEFGWGPYPELFYEEDPNRAYELAAQRILEGVN